MLQKDYKWENIRTLLTEGFNSEELYNFSFYESTFRPVYKRISKHTDQEEIVQLLIEHAEQKLLIEKLLDWAKKRNFKRYKEHLPYYFDPQKTTFDIKLHRHGSFRYEAIIDCPAGETSVQFQQPLEKHIIEATLAELRQNVQNIGNLTHSQIFTSETTKTPEEIGSFLSALIFSPEAIKLYQVSYQQVERLPIVLTLDCDLDDLIDMPWEFLYVPSDQNSTSRFLGLEKNMPIQRCWPKVMPFRPNYPDLLRVLLISPPSGDQISPPVKQEYDLIQNKLAALRYRSERNIKITFQFATTLTEFQQITGDQEKMPHLIHFIGHKGLDSMLLRDQEGSYRSTVEQDLLTSLKYVPSLRLVFFNSCETTQNILLAQQSNIIQSLSDSEIPAIVAMQFAVSDKAASIFTEEFYGAIVAGQPVEAAVAQGRQAMQKQLLKSSLEWAAPVLYLHSPHGHLFDDFLKNPEGSEVRTPAKVEPEAREVPTTQKDPCEPVAPSKPDDPPSYRESLQVKLDIYYQDGMQYFRQEKWETAISFLQTAHDLDPTYLDTGDMLQKARTKLQEQQQSRQKESRLKILFDQAVEHFRAKRWRETIDLLYVIQQDDPKFHKTDIERMTQDATANYQQELEHSAHRLKLETLYERAKTAMKEANWTRAIYVLEELGEQAPEGYRDISELHREARRQRLLSEEYGQGKTAFDDKNWVVAQEHFGRAYAIDDKYLDVAEKLEMAKREQTLDANYRKGIDFLTTGRWQAAIDTLTPIPADDPRRPDAPRACDYAQARLYMDKEEWAKAVQLLQPLTTAAYRDSGEQLKIAQQEERWAVAFERGQGAIERGNWEDAITAFKLIVDENQAYKQEDAFRQLKLAEQEATLSQLYIKARRHIDLEHWAEAISYLEQVKALQPNYEDIQTLWEQACRKKESLELYQRAIGWIKQENWSEAITIFQALLVKFPNYGDAPEQLKMAEQQVRLSDQYQIAMEAASQHKWSQAVLLLEPIVREKSDFHDAATQLSLTRRQARLQKLYEDGQNYVNEHCWDEAVVVLQELEAQLKANEPLDKPYANTHTLLSKARREKELADTLQHAKEEVGQQHWSRAIQLLQPIASTAPEAQILLDKAQEEKKLQGLYGDAQREFKAKDWNKAIKLFETINQLHPHYEETDNLLAQARHEQECFELYHKAIHQANQGELPQAIATFTQLLSKSPAYLDAPQRLEAARQQLTLLDEYRSAQAAMERSDWEQAVVLLERVVRVQDDFLNALDHLNTARRQAKLKQLYEEGKRYLRPPADWAKAINALEELLPQLRAEEPLDKVYADTSNLLVQARQEKEWADTYHQGREAIANKQWKQAIELLQKVKPEYEDTSTLLHLAQVERDFSQAYEAGREAYENQNWTEAISFFGEALRYKPDHNEAHSLQQEAKQQQIITEALQAGELFEAQQDWDQAIKAYRRVIEQERYHSEANKRLNEVERQQNLTQLMAEADQAAGEEKWTKAIEIFEKVILIDLNYGGVARKLADAKRKRNLAVWYEQAETDFTEGRQKYNREKLQNARDLFSQIAEQARQGYKETAQKLKIAEEELRLLDDYTSAESLYKIKDWSGAVKKFQEIEARRAGYQSTQAYLKQAKANRADEEQWVRVNELLQQGAPSEENLLKAKAELERIISSEASAYTEEAKVKAAEIQNQLTARLKIYYDDMLAQAEAERWHEALELLDKICAINIEFKEAPHKLKQIMLDSVNKNEKESKYETALEIYRLSLRIEAILERLPPKNLGPSSTSKEHYDCGSSEPTKSEVSSEVSQSTKQTSTILRRFTDVRFPEQCRIKKPVHLSVQLTLKPVEIEVNIPPEKPKPLPPIKVGIKPTPFEDKAKQVVLTVHISARNFKVNKPWQDLIVPFDKNSENIGFELVGQELGSQIIEVEIWHRLVRVGYIVIKTTVVNNETLSSRDAEQVIYQNANDHVLPDILEQPNVTIFADWHNDEISYWILEQDSRWPIDGGFMSLKNSQDIVTNFWKDLSNELEKAIQFNRFSQDELEDIWINIKSCGKDLYQKLLPAQLQKRASTWPEKSIIFIATNDTWIPWELIYDNDSDDFWGSKFILARVPKISGPEEFSSEDKTINQNSLPTPFRAVNVIGGELKPHIVERVRNLFSKLRPDILEKTGMNKVIQSVKGANLIHFTCHGHTTPRHCLQLADNVQMHCMTPVNINMFPEITHSIVFTNACSTAIPTSFLGESRSFGWEFYKKGATVYIGTLGLVPADYAITFAEHFYEKFLTGNTVGESLHHAKSLAKRENPFWLLYTLYGNPFTRGKAVNH